MRKLICLLLACGCALSLTGCVSKIDVQNNMVIETIGVDYENNQYVLSVSSIDSKKEIQFAAGRGKTVTEAIEDISLNRGKQLMFSSASSLILGSGVEGKVLENVFTVFSNNKNYNYEMDVFMAAKAAPMVQNDSSENLNNNLTNKVVNESSSYFTVKVALLDLLKEYYRSDNCFYVPRIKIDSGENKVVFSGAVIFADTKKVRNITQEEFTVLKLFDEEGKDVNYTLAGEYSVNISKTNVVARKVGSDIQLTAVVEGTVLESKDPKQRNSKAVQSKLERHFEEVVTSIVFANNVPVLGKLKNLNLTPKEMENCTCSVSVTYKEV